MFFGQRTSSSCSSLRVISLLIFWSLRAKWKRREAEVKTTEQRKHDWSSWKKEMKIRDDEEEDKEKQNTKREAKCFAVEHEMREDLRLEDSSSRKGTWQFWLTFTPLTLSSCFSSSSWSCNSSRLWPSFFGFPQEILRRQQHFRETRDSLALVVVLSVILYGDQTWGRRSK